MEDLTRKQLLNNINRVCSISFLNHYQLLNSNYIRIQNLKVKLKNLI